MSASAISYVEIGTNRYAPEGSDAVVLYSYNGVTGLTVAQLMMAVCIKLGCLIEDQSVAKMNQINASAAYLEVLAQVGSYVMERTSLDARLDLSKTAYTPKKVGLDTTYREFIEREVGVGEGVLPADVRSMNDKTRVFGYLESDMSRYSSDNEDQTIDLQSFISRRDSVFNASSSTVRKLGQTMNSVAGNF